MSIGGFDGIFTIVYISVTNLLMFILMYTAVTRRVQQQ